MKVRTGFVSNSSSSSFIVLKPSNKELTREIIAEFYLDEIGIEEEDMAEGSSYASSIDTILKKFGNKGELILTDIDYGAENDVITLLDKLGIKWIDMETL